MAGTTFAALACGALVVLFAGAAPALCQTANSRHKTACKARAIPPTKLSGKLSRSNGVLCPPNVNPGHDGADAEQRHDAGDATARLQPQSVRAVEMIPRRWNNRPQPVARP